MVTLNQIVQKLQDLALNHKQVKYFYYGNIVESLNNGDVSYPACFVQLAGATVTTEEDLTKYQFRIWFCDVLNISEGAKSNYTELQSDLVSIAEDMIAMINSTLLYGFWTVGTVYPLQFAEEEFRDYVVSVFFDIDISVIYLADRCQIPMYNDISFEPENDPAMQNIDVYRYTVQTESQSVTLPAMINKKILMLFVGFNPLTPVINQTDTPGVNQYRYTASSGLFEFGTMLEPDATNPQILQFIHQPL
jgi:hypothetical protein